MIGNLILMAVIVVIFLMAGAAVYLLFFGYLAYLEDDADAMWGPLIHESNAKDPGAERGD